MKTRDPIAWYQKPQDAGQIVDVTWTCLGESGAVRRTSDRASGEVCYYHHNWRARSERRFEPWNGIIDVANRCRMVSYEEVQKLYNG